MIADEIVTQTTRSPTETHQLGRTLAGCLQAGDVVNLRGDLGAGKTVMVKGMAEGMGFDPDEVQSPTFTLVREYKRPGARLYHLDLYRLNEAEEEMEEAGLDLYLPSDDGVTAVEWGERAAALLDIPHLDVTIDVTPSGREIAVRSAGWDLHRLQSFKAALAERVREGSP